MSNIALFSPGYFILELGKTYQNTHPIHAAEHLQQQLLVCINIIQAVVQINISLAWCNQA